MKSMRNLGSFRDPSGFIFTKDDILYRQVNFFYRKHYDALMESGLYLTLVKRHLLIPHEEVDISKALNKEAYKIIKPNRVSFISYPYEWCLSQLQSAALTTLSIQKIAVEHGMSLKDASAFNIQFHNGKAVFIDTLSFETYQEEKPWIAYQQFCRHFLAPLALACHCDVRGLQFSRIFIDGVPLDLAERLLGKSVFFSPALFFHIFLHSKSQHSFARRHKVRSPKRPLGKRAHLALLDSLESAVGRMRLKKRRSFWHGYYSRFESYDKRSFEHKQQLTEQFLTLTKPQSIWDLGSNTGEFSRIASKHGIPTVSFDYDHDSVDENFVTSQKRKDKKILPLVLDLTNPSPSLGWNHTERMSITERANADAVFALALMHHLVVGNNVSFFALAQFFSRLGSWLLIEYVPKTDSMVQKMLTSRKDIFQNYTQKEFEKHFSEFFTIVKSHAISHSERTLYFMKRK